MTAEPRFVVGSVTGAFIDPGATSTSKGTHRPLPTSYYVHDRAYCGRVVATFEAPRDNRAPGSLSGSTRLRLAQARCDELNAWDAEHGSRPVTPWPRVTMLEAEA